MFFIYLTAHASTLDSYKHNKLAESTDSFEIKEAESLILNLMGNKKEDLVLQYNLGVLYSKENPEKASKQFKYVLKSQECAKNSRVCKLSAFNLGVIKSKQNVDEAVMYYQKALRLDPDFYEAKHNLELLLKQKPSLNTKQNSKNQNLEDSNQNSEPQNSADQNLANKSEMLLKEILRQEKEILKRKKIFKKNVDKDW